MIAINDTNQVAVEVVVVIVAFSVVGRCQKAMDWVVNY